MQLNYITLPSSVTKSRLTSNQLRVLTYLYSLVFSHTKDKPRAKVRQEVIAARCRISVATVRRTVSVLEQRGFIVGKYRSKKASGYLGTYTYYLLPVGSEHFYAERRTALSLDGDLLAVYLLCCRLADSEAHWFYHSYSDLASFLGQRRSKVIALVEKLRTLKVVGKSKRLTSKGDYTDNLYTLTIHFFKASISKISVAVKCFEGKKIIIIAIVVESKVCAVSLFYLYFYSGGVGSDLSGLYSKPTKVFITRRKNMICLLKYCYVG